MSQSEHISPRRRALTAMIRIGSIMLPLMGGEQTTLLLVGSLVGILLAFGALGFGALVDLVSRLTFGSPEGRFSLEPREEILHSLLDTPWWWLLLAPALGGLLVGPLVYRFAREAKGHGIPEVMEAVALRGGRIRKRVAGLKILTSALTIGTGGSAGREGPVVQIGSSIASALAGFLRLNAARTKTLVACGAAAGIAATFNAPIAGVVFSLEIITGSFGLASFTPVVAAAVMATAVTHYLRGNVVVFEMPQALVEATALRHPGEVIPYIILGLLMGLASVAYTRTLYATEDRFDRLAIPAPLRAAVGGLMVGAIGIALPRVMGQGYETILAALNSHDITLFTHLGGGLGDLPPWAVTVIAMLVLAAAKIIATSFTIGSGGSGGVFAPSLFIGATLGGAYGVAAHHFFPDSTSVPAGYALVGMGAMVAGVTHAPISAVLILFEMTDDYDVILPLMLASVISTTVCHHLLGQSIYTLKLKRKGVSLHEGRDRTLLSELRVVDAMSEPRLVIPEATPFRRVVQMVTGSRGHTFPVVDRDGQLRGLLTLDDLRESLLVEELGDLVIAKELAQDVRDSLSPDDTLLRAFEVFGSTGLQELPVLRPGRPDQLLGMLDRSRAMDHYHRALGSRGVAGSDQAPAGS